MAALHRTAAFADLTAGVFRIIVRLLLVGGIAVTRIPIEDPELHERLGAAWERYRDARR